MVQQFKLYSYLNELNNIWSFSLKDFDDRIRLQKLVYLMQAFGCKLGYRYNMYIHGPYSTDLTKDAFELDALPNEITTWLKKENMVTEADKTKIAQLKEMLTDTTKTTDLEILATLHYLCIEAYIPNKSKTTIEKALIEKKPHLTGIPLDPYWSKLVCHGLIDSTMSKP